jgi:hypothetical protein
MRPVPDPLYGITLDDVSNLIDIALSIQSLPKMPTTRIVFDEGVNPSYYVPSLQSLRPMTYLMGELLDSEYVASTTVSQYSSRASQYLKALGNDVDIWEIGNEVNGEWVGKAPDVVAKISAAYNVVNTAGKKTALTLYYNPNCWSNKNNEMLSWADKNIPTSLKSGLNYVLVSYYEPDCNSYRPSPAEWTQVFTKLRQIFPNAKLGFGEVGLPNPVRSGTLSKAKDIMNYYYGLNIPVSGYIGGNFWWYAAEDIVPVRTRLWTTLSDAIIKAPY